jgi:hypothetical protein
VLDGGDTQIRTVAQGIINISATTVVAPTSTETLPVAEGFYLITAVLHTQPGDGHALRVGFAAGGVHTSVGSSGSTVAAADADKVTIDVVATQLVSLTQPWPLIVTSESLLAFGVVSVVAAQDAAGNLDVDFAETMTLIATGAGTAVLSGETTVAANGLASFAALTMTYTALADTETVVLWVDDEAGVGADLAAVSSSVITSYVGASPPPPPVTADAPVQNDEPAEEEPPAEPEIIYWVDLKVAPDTLNFGLVQKGRSTRRTAILTNPGNARLNVSSLQMRNSAFTVRSRNFTIEPGGTYELWFDYQPFETRLDTTTVTLGSSAPEMHTLFLTGAGVYPAKLQAETDSMAFGEVYLDSERFQNMTLENTGGDTLRLQVELPSEEFSVTPTEAMLLPGEATVLQVTLSPGAHGPLSATLTMPNNGVDDTVRVALAGDGVDRLVRFDVSGNGVIDAHDLQLMTEVLNGQPQADGIDLDYTRDGVIDEADLDVLVSWVEYQPVRRVVTDRTGIAILLETTGTSRLTPSRCMDWCVTTVHLRM